MQASPASPPSIDVRSSPSPHRAALGLEIGLIVLAVLLLVIGAVALLFYLRQRRLSTNQSTTHTHRSLFSKTSSTSTLPDTPDSPAYSLAGQTPRYKHVPGSHMRIAHRDWDGSWKLLDPDSPFRPSGVSEVSPSPSSSTFRFGNPPFTPVYSESVETLSVTRGYNGYDYDNSNDQRRTSDFGDEVLDISPQKSKGGS